MWFVCVCVWFAQNVVRKYLEKAEAIDEAQCSKQQKLSLILLRDQLQEYLDGAVYKG